MPDGFLINLTNGGMIFSIGSLDFNHRKNLASISIAGESITTFPIEEVLSVRSIVEMPEPTEYFDNSVYFLEYGRNGKEIDRREIHWVDSMSPSRAKVVIQHHIKEHLEKSSLSSNPE